VASGAVQTWARRWLSWGSIASVSRGTALMSRLSRARHLTKQIRQRSGQDSHAAL